MEGAVLRAARAALGGTAAAGSAADSAAPSVVTSEITSEMTSERTSAISSSPVDLSIAGVCNTERNVHAAHTAFVLGGASAAALRTAEGAARLRRHLPPAVWLLAPPALMTEQEGRSPRVVCYCAALPYVEMRSPRLQSPEMVADLMRSRRG